MAARGERALEKWRAGADIDGALLFRRGAYDPAIRHALNPLKRLAVLLMFEPHPRKLVHTQHPPHLSGKAERLADQPNGVFHVQPIELA